MIRNFIGGAVAAALSALMIHGIWYLISTWSNHGTRGLVIIGIPFALANGIMMGGYAVRYFIRAYRSMRTSSRV